MTKLIRQRVFVAIAVAVPLAAAVAAQHGCAKSAREVQYVTAPIERGRIQVVVTATGTVNPVATVQVGTYVSGPIQKIYVDFNSKVTKGQLVAEIDPQPFLLRVTQAEANLANAQARVEQSRADLEFKRLTLQRNRDLFAKALVARSDLDAAESSFAQAQAQLHVDEAQVLQAKAALDEAKVNLGYARIASPVDGIVVSRNVDVGQTVAASFQTPTLFLIAEDLTKMQVNANVSESDIGGVREEQAARFTVDAYPDRPLQGVVTQVRNAPLTVQNVVTYDVVIAVDNSDLMLKPGMTANVSIIIADRDGVLRVPSAALRFHPTAQTAPADGERSSPTVWRQSASGSLEPVPVEVGIADEQYTQIQSDALHESDEVVLAIKGEKTESEAPQVLGMPRFRR